MTRILIALFATLVALPAVAQAPPPTTAPPTTQKILTTPNLWVAGQTVAEVPLTDAATLVTNAQLGNIFTDYATACSTDGIGTGLSNNSVLANPYGMKPGQGIMWKIQQPATGATHTLSYGSMFKFTTPSGSSPAAPALTATNCALDVISCEASGASGPLICIFLPNFAKVATIGSSAPVFDPARIDANITLSNGNTTATNPTSSGTANVAPGFTFHSSGKYIMRFHIVATQGGNLDQIGLADSTAASAVGNYLGQTADSWGSSPVGHVIPGGANNGPVYSTGSNIDMAVDLTGKLLWWSADGGTTWNGSTINGPANGVGGLDISSVFSMTLAPSVNVQQVGSSITLAVTPAATVPTGYTSW